MYTVSVALDPPYSVQIGPGLLNTCGERLRDLLPQVQRVAVITDETVGPLYLSAVTDSLEAADYAPFCFSLPAGEASKTLSRLADVLEFLAQCGLDRQDCVLALGGGVVGDLAGFAAGCYLRGIACVLLPTTLLSAVDASVGGKTAVDLRAGKNLAGLFVQPKAVWCDTDCLATLSGSVLAEGMAEAVKTGILASESLFSLAKTARTADLPALIARCVGYKAGLVARDEREQGLRKLLNLGHTAGHAMELCSDYSILHGQAVAMGLSLISRASEALGWCREPVAELIESALEAHGLPTTPPFSPKRLAEAALADKKRRGNQIALVIPRGLGDCVLRTVPLEGLEEIFSAGMK